MSSSTQNFDLIIIGAGPAGYVSAIKASQLGLNVAIIEKRETPGGTCLNVGCIPAKALLSSTEHFHFLKHDAAEHGILADNLRPDVSALIQRKDKVVRTLTQGVNGLFRKNKITSFTGTGVITAKNQVEVRNNDSTTLLQAEKILIATGSVPSNLPNIPFDGERIVSSTEALSFSEVPARLVVIGGGAIGLELGSVWARLGSEVTVLEFLPAIAAGFDPDVSKALQASLQKSGLKFHLATKVTHVDFDLGHPRVHAEKNGESLSFEADKVLVSVGRKPYFEGLFTEAVTPETDNRGRIVVDEKYQTSIPGIYAIGDVIAGPMLAHKAEEEGIACVELMTGHAGHVAYDYIPNVVYTEPEAASVGLTEPQAKEKGFEVRTGKFPFMANGRALAHGIKDGFVKIIADAKTDRVLGVHMLGHSTSELIAECVLLMEFRGSAEDLARTVHAHPTLSEVVKEAAIAVTGKTLHM